MNETSTEPDIRIEESTLFGTEESTLFGTWVAYIANHKTIAVCDSRAEAARAADAYRTTRRKAPLILFLAVSTGFVIWVAAVYGLLLWWDRRR